MIGKGQKSAFHLAALVAAAAIAAGCSTTQGSTSTGSGTSGDATYLASAEPDDEETLICRRERPTGSRISEKVCLTAADWKKIEQQSQEMLDRATRKAQQYGDQD